MLYGCETWKVDTKIINRLQVFINRCLRKILRIFWPVKIRNEDLLHMAHQNIVQTEIKRRKWSWIGHILRRPDTNVTKLALEWNPQGSRGRGRPKNTWKRSVMKEATEIGTTWSQLKSTAKNRIRWRHVIEALCSTGE